MKKIKAIAAITACAILLAACSVNEKGPEETTHSIDVSYPLGDGVGINIKDSFGILSSKYISEGTLSPKHSIPYLFINNEHNVLIKVMTVDPQENSSYIELNKYSYSQEILSHEKFSVTAGHDTYIEYDDDGFQFKFEGEASELRFLVTPKNPTEEYIFVKMSKIDGSSFDLDEDNDGKNNYYDFYSMIDVVYDDGLILKDYEWDLSVTNRNDIDPLNPLFYNSTEWEERHFSSESNTSFVHSVDENLKIYIDRYGEPHLEGALYPDGLELGITVIKHETMPNAFAFGKVTERPQLMFMSEDYSLITGVIVGVDSQHDAELKLQEFFALDGPHELLGGNFNV